MNREHLEELAALHALGLLEGEEKRAFEQELRDNPAARELAASMTHVSARLALAAPQIEPPPSLKERVLHALPERGATVAGAMADAPRPASTPQRAKQTNLVWFTTVLPWGLAAGLAIVCGAMWRTNDRLHTQIAALEQQSDLDRVRIAVLNSLLKDAPNARAVAVWDPARGRGVLTVTGLPPVGPANDYQLWVVSPTYQDPVDGGVFNTTSDGTRRFDIDPRFPVSDATAFAVTVEPKGGVPKSVSADGPVLMGAGL